MTKKISIAALTLLLSLGLAGLVQGQANAAPGVPAGHTAVKYAANTVNITVWVNGTNPRRGAPKVYVTTHEGRFITNATRVGGVQRAFGRTGYSYVARNVPFNTRLDVRVAARERFMGGDRLVLRQSGRMTQRAMQVALYQEIGGTW